MLSKNFFALAALGIGLSLTACGGADGGRTAGVNGAGTSTAQVSAAEAPASKVTPTGRVIEVKMITDGEGNYFEPADFEARQGDLIKFVLVSGVHNVSFPAAQNKGLKNLPEASDYLQLPGQSFDLLVTMEPGRYFYQCDPHAALGMVGHIEVKSD